MGHPVCFQNRKKKQKFNDLACKMHKVNSSTVYLQWNLSKENIG